MKYLEEQGFHVTYLPVDNKGRIRLEDLQKAMSKDTILVSIMPSHRYTDYVGRGFPSGITVDFHMVYTRPPADIRYTGQRAWDFCILMKK